MRKFVIMLPLAVSILGSCNEQKNSEKMSNKHTVERYMEGFNSTDHKKILSCVTDDVIWDMPGFFHHEGIEAFDKEIENPNADGNPEIHIIRMVEEGNIVIAEGTVKAKMKDGNLLDAVFCDVFHFRDAKICKLSTYLMFNKK